MKRLCVYAGAGDSAHPEDHNAARSLGGELATQRIRLIFGGARLGLMGVLADAVLEGGGEVTGVMPEHLASEEALHPGITELRLVKSMHERKALMAELADAFIALPGGLGTIEELLEAATWSQLGIHAKPCGVLNVCGYFDPLLAQLDAAVPRSFLSAAHRSIVFADQDPKALLAALAEWETPAPKYGSRAAQAQAQG